MIVVIQKHGQRVPHVRFINMDKMLTWKRYYTVYSLCSCKQGVHNLVSGIVEFSGYYMEKNRPLFFLLLLF